MGKSSFVLFAQIGPLLNLEHFQVRQNPEAMACRDQQEKISFRQPSAAKILALWGIKINLHGSLGEIQNLLGLGYGSGYPVMNVGINHPSFFMGHPCDLLGIVIGCQKPDPPGRKASP